LNEFKDQKILIVGGAGFVGSNLARKLLESTPRDLLIVDNLLSAERVNVPDHEAVTFVEGSITDEAVLGKLTDDFNKIEKQLLGDELDPGLGGQRLESFFAWQFRVARPDKVGCVADVDHPDRLVSGGLGLFASIPPETVAFEHEKLVVAQCDEIVSREVFEGMGGPRARYSIRLLEKIAVLGHRSARGKLEDQHASGSSLASAILSEGTLKDQGDMLAIGEDTHTLRPAIFIPAGDDFLAFFENSLPIFSTGAIALGKSDPSDHLSLSRKLIEKWAILIR
jgi:hypothetical protein